MAYADQRMSAGRIWAIVIVALLHALIGYAFVTGLATKAIKQIKEDLKTFDVEEPPPPEEEPPPPPPDPQGYQADQRDREAVRRRGPAAPRGGAAAPAAGHADAAAAADDAAAS